MSSGIGKTSIDTLALFGGEPLFRSPKPTSNLVRPDPERFFHYSSRISDDNGHLAGELEKRLAAMHDAKYCITANSGFWALTLLVDAIRLPGRSEVILPSLTYRRMADIIAWVGLVPHFCDVDRSTLANTATTIEPCLNEKTAAIIGVHPVGGHCDIDGLTSMAKAHGIPLIFDSVESVHERHGGLRIGAFGDAELFSLGASKLVNGFEGGYITTNNPELAMELRRRCKGERGNAETRALSVEMPEIHAAMALAGLDGLPQQLERNLARFEAYRAELADMPELRLVIQNPDTEPSHKNIVVQVLEGWPYSRDQTVRLLNAEMILARAYYAPPLTQKPMSYPHIAGELPNTDWVAERFISMPCGHLVSLEDIARIAEFLRYLKKSADAISSSLANI